MHMKRDFVPLKLCSALIRMLEVFLKSKSLTVITSIDLGVMTFAFKIYVLVYFGIDQP